MENLINKNIKNIHVDLKYFKNKIIFNINTFEFQNPQFIVYLHFYSQMILSYNLISLTLNSLWGGFISFFFYKKYQIV